MQALGIRPGEPGVPIGAPLHRGPHAVPIAQVEVVSHADLVAVVDDRGPREGKQQAVHEPDLVPVVPQ